VISYARCVRLHKSATTQCNRLIRADLRPLRPPERAGPAEDALPYGSPGLAVPGASTLVSLTRARAIGSAGERLVHTEEVTGSIPVSPTDVRPVQRLTDSSHPTHRMGAVAVLGGIWEIVSSCVSVACRMRMLHRPDPQPG
jgi:hypothetical protein